MPALHSHWYVWNDEEWSDVVDDYSLLVPGPVPVPVPVPERETSEGCCQLLWKLLLLFFKSLLSSRGAIALLVVLLAIVVGLLFHPFLSC